jgi:UDP-N-acetylmuramate dehydrogenase
LIKAAAAAKKSGLPIFVIGGGSNILAGDEGFRGLVIKNEISFIAGGGGFVSVGAGTRLSALADYYCENSLSGMEWAAGIPGTVGGAVRGNAGAALESMADAVESVDFFDASDSSLKINSCSKKECRFDYRESIFKKKRNLIIVSCALAAKKGDSADIKNKMADCLAKKKESQPLGYPSAGSIFKNPDGEFAARLIQDCGLKGKKIGGAMISEKHANFIINAGNATANDVMKLISLAKSEVLKKTGIRLEVEVEFLTASETINP